MINEMLNEFIMNLDCFQINYSQDLILKQMICRSIYRGATPNNQFLSLKQDYSRVHVVFVFCLKFVIRGKFGTKHKYGGHKFVTAVFMFRLKGAAQSGDGTEFFQAYLFFF